MANIAEVRSENYRIFNRFESAKRQELIHTVEYIQMMASTTATPIDEWDIRKLFGVRDEGTNELITDRREINRRFWAQAKEDSQNAPTPEPTELSASILDNVRQLALRKAESVKAGMQETIRSRLREAQDYGGRQQRALSAMAKCQLELAGFDGSGLDLEAEVTRILELDFFQLQPDMCSDSQLVFITPEVICDYTVRNETTPPARNMGQYKVVFKFDQNDIRVLRWQRNRTYNGHTHPFIASGGSVCWGNENQLVNEHWQHMRWSAVFGILANLLQRFDQNSDPYVSLGSFTDEQAPQAAPRTGSADSCPNPNCNSTDITEDEDDNGPYFICESCGHDWE